MGKILLSKREILFMQCGGVCPECGKKMQIKHPGNKKTYMTLDHMVPKSKGGSNHITNMRPLCWECNQMRGNDDIENLVSFNNGVQTFACIVSGKDKLDLDIALAIC